MAYQDDIALMAHLMRRAGFGATRDELEARVAKGYEATVEELLHPETQPAVDAYSLLRYQPASLLPGGQPPMGNVHWLYYLVNTQRPLEEKMALFWHHVFATGNSKVDNYDQLLEQIELFRQNGMGNYRELLLEDREQPDDDVLAGQQPEPRHGGQRELGPRTAGAVQPRRRQLHRGGCPRRPRAPSPAGPSRPRSRAARTAGSRGSSSIGRKTTTTARRCSSATRGDFNGEDIIDIVVQQPACGKFICRHLYNFFVADEPQVPAWPIEAPRDPEAIDEMVGVFRDSKFEMKPVLRQLFNSRLLQESPLPAPEVAGRGRRRHAAPGRRLRAAEARLWRAVDAHRLYGPGPAQPAVGRGLAHRQGVDQQRLVDGAHQLRGREGRRYLGCRASARSSTA